MQYIIYLNEENQPAGKMSLDPNSFQTILQSIPADKILHYNGKNYEENYPEMFESDKATFLSLIKAIKRPWDARRIMVRPELTLDAPIAAPVEQPAKKKRGRPKKQA